MIKPRLVLVTTADVGFHFKVAAGTVRRWASEDRWPRYGTRRARLWNLRDAQKSYDNHRDS